jgi:DNA gyrase subunit A
MTEGNQDLVVVSEQGKAIRFNEEDVRAVGRTAAGVNAMRLDQNDFLTGADVIVPDHDLLLITEKGYGKRTSVEAYRRQSRYGKGVRAMELSQLTGKLVSARVVENEDEVTFISANGIMLRTSVATISRQGRRTRGVTVMDLKEGDAIVSVAIVREGRLSMVGGDRSEQAPEELDEELAVQSPASGENGREASQIN